MKMKFEYLVSEAPLEQIEQILLSISFETVEKLNACAPIVIK